MIGRLAHFFQRRNTILVLQAGAVLLLISSVLTWTSVSATEGEVAFTGAELTTLVRSIAVIGVGGGVLITIARRWVRGALAAVLLGGGLIALVAASVAMNAPRPYSMEAYDVGPEGDSNILWRQDCSGFVSMALAARDSDNPTGFTTETLHPQGGYDIAHPITQEELLPGDFILQLNGDSSSGVGHVVLFNGWAEGGGYHCLEQSFGGGGTVARVAGYPYDNLAHYHPFRYNRIVD